MQAKTLSSRDGNMRGIQEVLAMCVSERGRMGPSAAVS